MADAPQDELDDVVPDLVPSDAPSASKLNELILAGNLQFKLKNYDAAADIYSHATEMQAELNGEMDPKNAELLFRYGRCLFELAKSKSDVLGGKVAGEKKAEKKARPNPVLAGNGEGSSSNVISSAMQSGDEKLAAEIVEAKVEEKDGKGTLQDEVKPFFQFTAEDDDDDDEDGDEDEEGEAEDDEDDFATAFEILDIARVLLERQLGAALEGISSLSTEHPSTTTTVARTTDGKDPASANSLEPNPAVHKIKDLLADTHDQQAEIALENEQFKDAVADFRATLSLRQSIYPTESELIAESHYKLSLALEFDSMTAVRDAQAQESINSELGAAGGDRQQPKEAPKVDEAMREEARLEMERAIESCRLRVIKEEKELPNLEGDARATKEKGIRDVKELTAEMEQRLIDLSGPAVISVSGNPAGAPDNGNPLNGVLGQIFGESTAQQKARIDEATRNATDLSGLVRRKKPAPGAADADVKGKRKLQETDDPATTEVKRAKTEEPA